MRRRSSSTADASSLVATSRHRASPDSSLVIGGASAASSSSSAGATRPTARPCSGRTRGPLLGCAPTATGDGPRLRRPRRRRARSALLEVATPAPSAPAGPAWSQSLVSHASLVFDERLFMKCYRVLEPAPEARGRAALRPRRRRLQRTCSARSPHWRAAASTSRSSASSSRRPRGPAARADLAARPARRRRRDADDEASRRRRRRRAAPPAATSPSEMRRLGETTGPAPPRARRGLRRPSAASPRPSSCRGGHGRWRSRRRTATTTSGA